MNSPASRDPISLETAERMLSFVRGVDDRTIWVKLAYVLKDEFGDAAFDAWNAWSMDAASYNERAARDVWKSVKTGAGSNRATIGTLIALAKEGGWKPSDQDRRTVSPEEHAQRAAERAARLEAERLETEREQAAAAAKAAEMWANAEPATAHPYLTRKGISGPGARTLGDFLLIPVKQSAKQLAGLQTILPDGSKLFLKGTQKKGAYCVIGKPGTVIAICEGYATGVSIHMATGHCVVVAFDAGNLRAVAEKMRALMPAATFIICADDDTWTDGNPGMTSAWEASSAIGGMVAFPRWYGDRPEGRTDFNDLHADEGLEAVAECIHHAIDPSDPSESRGAAPYKQPRGASPTATKPVSGGAAPTAENTGSDVSGFHPLPEGVAVQEPARPVMVPGSGSDVEVRTPLVDYYGWLQHVNDKGKPLATIENLQEICERLGVTIRYNVISKEEEILIPGEGFSVDNKLNASLAWIISQCHRFKLPVQNVPDYLTYMADRNLYNPVANWINSKPWDGVDRLQQLIDTVRASGQGTNPKVMHMKTMFIRRWMLSAVAAVFRPEGVSAAGVLVFQGDQYIGKTKWFKTLVPAELRVLQDGVILRPDDRDSVKQCVSNWLVELGELDATFRKSDIAALKSFLTKDRDILRRAFAKKESEYARRTVFFASVNPREFLHDPTGNRRYWTIECESLDHSHTIDMQQCWAQVHQLWQAGEAWYLTASEVDDLNQHNKDFEVIDPIAELIGSGLNWKAEKMDWQWLSATQVLKLLGRDTPSQGEATRAAHVIREMNGKNSRKVSGVRQLYVPPSWRHRDYEN